MTALVGLDCGDDPEAWAALGFEVVGGVQIGPVRVGLDGRGGGLRGWTLAGTGAGDVAGIPTVWVPEADPTVAARDLDHVVLVTGDLDGTVAELVGADGDERRRLDVGRGRMAFVRLGPVIVEIVERDGPARLWGLVAVVDDLDSLPAGLVGEPRAAVQPGRRIVTARPAPGLDTALAFMTPRVRAHPPSGQLDNRRALR